MTILQAIWQVISDNVLIIQLFISIPGLILVYHQLYEIHEESKVKMVVGKFEETVEKPVDSDWSIRILHPDRPIEKCIVLFNKKELPWWDKDVSYCERIILEGEGGNVRIPRDIYTEDAEVKVKDGKKTLRKVKFKDMPVMKQ